MERWSRNTSLTVDIFAWTWNFWGGGTENTSKQRKIVAFICEELLSENDFEAVSATFCCYDHGANASSEELQIKSITNAPRAL